MLISHLHHRPKWAGKTGWILYCECSFKAPSLLLLYPPSQPQSPLLALESSLQFKTVSKLNVGNVKASFCGPGWEMVLIVSKKILHWPSLVHKAAQSQKEAGKCDLLVYPKGRQLIW